MVKRELVAEEPALSIFVANPCRPNHWSVSLFMFFSPLSKTIVLLPVSLKGTLN